MMVSKKGGKKNGEQNLNNGNNAREKVLTQFNKHKKVSMLQWCKKDTLV